MLGYIIIGWILNCDRQDFRQVILAAHALACIADSYHYYNISVSTCIAVYTCIYTELIAIGTGLKIHPIPIETEVKTEIPLVRNVVVIGEGRKYLSCLLTLKVSNNITTMVLD